MLLNKQTTLFKYFHIFSSINHLEKNCVGKTCGEPCTINSFPGVCDGKGFCRDIIENPCSVHGCEGKQCGDECLMGDIIGWCNIDGKCDFGGIPTCRMYTVIP